MKFTESHLEQAFIELLAKQDIPHINGKSLIRDKQQVILEEDLTAYLLQKYKKEKLTANEVKQIIHYLTAFSNGDLYESNKSIMKLVADGFALKREDHRQKDIWIYLIDYSSANKNIYKFVNQLEIEGFETRIPDGILYINGLPLVVFEFKSAIREDATIYNAYVQLTTRYRRDIPALFKYNGFCVISDGVNTKAGSFFAPYDFYYAWRRTNSVKTETDGINGTFTLVNGMLNPKDLRNILHHFIYFPDTSKKDEKIVCRYPQYYATNKLYQNIKHHQKPKGDGKGGTYFGATGCGKSFTMLFLTRLLMKSKSFSSPTIVLITDRTDLDDQLAHQFTNAKSYIGDNTIISVESRADLRKHLQNRQSGGVFLTTIHKFTEDTDLLSERTNIICISDEAHRSQTNLDQKITVSETGVKKTFGFAKYLHYSLPNATYVGFTGTPIDATLDVFGKVVDAYTMKESVKDEITVPIVYEGRSAKVLLNANKVQEIEAYYVKCAKDGANEHQIEQSKKATATMDSIIGDKDVLKTVAKDFINHYENRVKEGATVNGKALFVASNRAIAYDFYREIIALKPEWAEVKICDDESTLTEEELKELKPIEKIKLVMTRGKDDPKALFDMLGTKEDRKELDRQFKNEKSNFKIAIVVDMWLTGFDVPFLDSIYIYKPIQRHNLIQTISRVNRKFTGKSKGLVTDYIGIKKQMNLALAEFGNIEEQSVEDIEHSIVIVKDHLDLLKKLFHTFDDHLYFSGSSLEQLEVLNKAVEFVQQTQAIERRFLDMIKRLKAAYDICAGQTEAFTQNERDYIHFYLALRSILLKLTKGDAPDTVQMNAKVQEMIEQAILSQGVEEIVKLGEDEQTEIDIFSDDYLEKINKLKLPNTKIKLLQKLLKQAIGKLKKVNKVKGVDFSQRLQSLVAKYNKRDENDLLRGEVLEDFTNEIMELFYTLQKELSSGDDLGIDIEEKAFYDILKSLAHKYDFDYPEEKLIALAKEVKMVVDDKAKYTDWSKRDDLKAELKVDLIILLAENGYPPVDRDEVYKEIFEQAQNFKKNKC